MAELERLIGGPASRVASATGIRPHVARDAFFYPGSILSGTEHRYALCGRELFRDSANPARDAFFYRDIHQFHIAEN